MALFKKKKTEDNAVKIKKRSGKAGRIIKPIIFVLVVAAVCGGVYMYRKNKTAKEAQSDATASTSIVTRGNLINSITGSGTVEPLEEREIVPEVNGKIMTSPFEEGANVSEGDILYTFEMTSAENAIKTAQNSVKCAENNVQKA